MTILGHNFTPLRFQNTSTDSGFQKAGHALINRAHVKNRVKTFKLCDAMHPVEGTLQLSLKCCAETYGAIAHRGFLSLYQTVDNMGSWTRFWCALFEGCMRFWRYPEDEDTKVFVYKCENYDVLQKPLVTLRMDDFISEIKAVPPTVASFQFSMEGHIRILKDKNSFEDIK